MRKLNLNYLVKVEVQDEKQDITFKVIEHDIKFLGITIRKAGIFDILDRRINIEEFPNNFLRNGLFYKRPYLKLFFVNDHTLTIYYDTFEEAKKQYICLTSKGSWVDAN